MSSCPSVSSEFKECWRRQGGQTIYNFIHLNNIALLVLSSKSLQSYGHNGLLLGKKIFKVTWNLARKNHRGTISNFLVHCRLHIIG